MGGHAFTKEERSQVSTKFKQRRILPREKRYLKEKEAGYQGVLVSCPKDGIHNILLWI